jgi:hypothetical protein
VSEDKKGDQSDKEFEDTFSELSDHECSVSGAFGYDSVDGNETETGSKSSFNLDAYLEESRQ